jgi:hypothetical protein
MDSGIWSLKASPSIWKSIPTICGVGRACLSPSWNLETFRDIGSPRLNSAPDSERVPMQAFLTM